MNVLIILGHPDKKSFNHAIAKACIAQVESNGHTVLFHDLYAEKFNPLHQIDNLNQNEEVDDIVKIHCSHLKKSDAIIVIHPNWWGQPPAIIKGWLDRVFLPGVAYDFISNNKGKQTPVGLLKAQTGLVLNTSNAPSTIENDFLQSIWKNHVFGFCGVKKIERKNFAFIKGSDNKQRAKWLLEVKQMVASLFPVV